MFTLEGHSVVQALQERQLLSAASSSGAAQRVAARMPRNSSAARIALARPRVHMISSPVAMNVGHMVGVSLRQPPQPLHCSRLRGERAVLRRKGQHRRRTAASAHSPRPGAGSSSMWKRPSGMILPGLNRLCGSKDALISRMTPQQAVAELLGHEFGPRDADAVFAGQRALELADQRGDFSRRAGGTSSGPRPSADRARAARAASPPPRGHNTRPAAPAAPSAIAARRRTPAGPAGARRRPRCRSTGLASPLQPGQQRQARLAQAPRPGSPPPGVLRIILRRPSLRLASCGQGARPPRQRTRPPGSIGTA